MTFFCQIGVFFLTLFLSLKLTPFFIQLGHERKFLDIPHDRKAHPNPTPYLGGFSIFICYWVVFCVLALSVPFFKSSFQEISLHNFQKMSGVFIGGVFIFIVGFLDDRFDLNPALKLLGQAAAALILMKNGLMVNLLAGFDGIGYIGTFVWILAIMNAFNFIDSVDGHCAGVALVSCLIFYCISAVIYQPVLGFAVLILGGAIGGFLRYNWKPARIFLGDNGSLFLGYMMAAFTLLFSYRSSHFSIVTPFIPIFMFGVPIYDTVSVIIVRIFRGIPPWKGDRNHFAHRLVRLGMSDKVAVMVSYFIAFTLGLVALLSTQINTFFGKVIILFLFISVIGIIALLEYYAAGHIRRMETLAAQKKRRRDDKP